ncbi:nuclear transport factor 2 family protein [Kitasatospora acidiphila]|uniref:Nuclear transport factor 2 family protein n=1 Tax=Kitasatospora acidiphila TaxID=2567942 RepID=A0A540VZP2_9ACTN|nr:nuclear transport factor 2 family protein [Kitasatospora acidiphila]TQF02210.1 nuclear transport factor 2 family protein [Kitasatospora acidiphila]
MSETATPREVFEKLHAGITSGEFAGLADLYAEDAVVEIVFEPLAPRRIEGQAAIRERFGMVRENVPFTLTGKNQVIRETDDPEVIVAEYDYEVYQKSTDTTFEVSNIQVLRVRDGLIVHSRDFHDHLGFIKARGGLSELVEKLQGE